MVRHSANSLRSKIWLATGALILFVFAFGIGSWLVVSLFTENSFYATLFRFVVLTLAIAAYGWWLVNEVVRPIEKVSLLAKSIERGTTTTLPKNSGSFETDELLHTLYRNNQQLQNLVGLMDKVSGGNLDVALAPLQQSDRLSQSFQKLLAKVTESIDAKRDLEWLKSCVKQISEEISEVRRGNFDVEIKADFAHTREISDALKFLVSQLNALIYQVKTDAQATQFTAREAQKNVQHLISADETRIKEMNRAMFTFKQIPQTVQSISQELYGSAHAARQSIERARNGSEKARKNLTHVNTLRHQIREAVKRTGNLGTRALEIAKAAKTIEDLAQRTNMIALNAAIAAERDGSGRGNFVNFAEEVERLAERAAASNKQIATLSQTVEAEVSEIESSLQESVSEAANLSRYAIETGSALSELEKYITQFLNLQEKLAAFSGEQTADTESAFQTFNHSITDAENQVKNMKETERQFARMFDAMESLRLAVADYKITPIAAKELPPPVAVKALLTTDEIITDFEPEFYSLEEKQNAE